MAIQRKEPLFKPIVVYSDNGGYLLTLDAETKHVWLDLCAEAALCEDPARLGQLELQIVHILRQEQQRAAKMPPDSPLRNRTVA
jgi:hypothetical protein